MMRTHLFYVPDRNRTDGLALRRRSLYPTELREQIMFIVDFSLYCVNAFPSKANHLSSSAAYAIIKVITKRRKQHG